MVEAEVLDLVLSGVDLLIGVVKVRFDHECGWVAVAAGGGVVGAGVAALCQDKGDVAVLNHVSIRLKLEREGIVFSPM